MKNLSLITASLALLLLNASAVSAASCGTNEGWLPWLTRSSAPSHLPSTAKQTVTQYNNCGLTRESTATSASATWYSCDTTSGTTGWQPTRSSVCKNVAFTETCTRWNKERRAYGTGNGSNWSPATSTVCSTQTFTQTSNCGVTREVTGTKACCGSWSPALSTVCDTETVTQTNQCGETRQGTGTKDCCVVESWSPAQSDMCSGIDFQQVNNCGGTRTVTGTGSCILEDNSQLALNEGDFPHDSKIARLTSTDLLTSGLPHITADSTNVAKLYSRKMPDNRTGAWVNYPIVVTGQNLPNNSQIPMFTRGNDFAAFLNAKAKNSMLNNPQPSDEVVFCLDTMDPPTAADIVSMRDNSTCVDSGPRDLSCGPHQIVQNCGCQFNTVGALYPLCDECVGISNIPRTVNYTVPVDNNWRPAASTVCAGTNLVQTNDCGNTRTVPGTRDCSGPPSPPSLKWEFTGRGAATNTIPSTNSASFNCLAWFVAPPTSHASRLWSLTYDIGSNYSCSVPGQTDTCFLTLINGVAGTPTGCPIGGDLCGAGTGVTFQRHNFRCQ